MPKILQYPFPFFIAMNRGFYRNLPEKSLLRALQGYCESISPSILNKRLSDLREAKPIERSLYGCHLTALGKELYSLLIPFGEWSIAWAKQIAPEGVARWENCRADQDLDP